jgi:hypothetical protein
MKQLHQRKLGWGHCLVNDWGLLIFELRQWYYSNAPDKSKLTFKNPPPTDLDVRKKLIQVVPSQGYSNAPD